MAFSDLSLLNVFSLLIILPSTLAHAEQAPVKWTVQSYQLEHQTPSLQDAFEARQASYQRLASSDIISAYQHKPLDRKRLADSVANLETNTLADFKITELMRIMGFTDQYDDIIIPKLQTIPFWLTENELTRNYWSENHMIMWMSAAWLLHEKNKIISMLELRARLTHWLDLKLQYGYYEFFSPTYAPFSLAALLNLYDFSTDQEIKEKSGKAALILLSDMVLNSNQKGLAFPVAGRAYRSSYTSKQPQGSTYNKITALLTGLGQQPISNAGHQVDSLATTSLDVSPAISSQKSSQEIIYHIGHDLKDVDKIHAGMNAVDKTLFEWSAGGYFHPQVADETYTLLTTYHLWEHPDFKGFSMLGKPAEATQNYLNAMALVAKFGATILSDVSKGSVISGVNAYIYKNDNSILSSIIDFNPGRIGYQAWPWVASAENAATFTQGGDSGDKYVANLQLPKVTQHGNLALIQYKPSKVNQLLAPVLGYKDFTVRLHWPEELLDEQETNGHWRLGKVNTAYLALFQSCGLESFLCDSYLQTWAVMVGNQEQDGSFEQFKAKVLASKIQSTWHFNYKKFQFEFLSVIQTADKKIVSSWPANQHDLYKVGTVSKTLL